MSPGSVVGGAGWSGCPCAGVHHARVRSENEERPGCSPVFRNIGVVSGAQTQ